MISAKQMCIDGTAAYVLTKAPAGVLSLQPFPPVTSCETVSVNPHSGISRGGAVGYSQYPTSAMAIDTITTLRTK